MKFSKLKSKDYMLIAIVAVAVLFFVQAIRNQRENFTDNGWKADDGTLLSVSITEDGTLWGITPDNAIWRKTKGGAWGLTKGRAAAGTNIQGQSSTEAYAIGVEGGIQVTNDGGETWKNLGRGAQAKWVTRAQNSAVVVGTDGKFYTVDTNGSTPYPGGGGGLMVAGNGVDTLYTITGDGMVWKSQNNATWQNMGYAARFIAVDKNGSVVQLGYDGKLQYRPANSSEFIPFSGTVRNISASSTMLAATTNDNKTQTMDISGTAAAPSGPSPSSAPGLTAGTYSATCPTCSVVNGQISCACDVLPKA